MSDPLAAVAEPAQRTASGVVCISFDRCER